MSASSLIVLAHTSPKGYAVYEVQDDSIDPGLVAEQLLADRVWPDRMGLMYMGGVFAFQTATERYQFALGVQVAANATRSRE